MVDPLHLNGTIHDVLEALWMEAMEAVTALELRNAAERWERFETGLRLHAHREDQDVMPVYVTLGPFPRGGAPDIVRAEHLKLEKLGRAGRRAIAHIGDRADMIRQLPHLMRVHQLFEHHTQREQSMVYPTLLARCEEAERGSIGATLQRSLSDVEELARAPSS